jgi:hypothetical protein
MSRAIMVPCLVFAIMLYTFQLLTFTLLCVMSFISAFPTLPFSSAVYCFVTVVVTVEALCNLQMWHVAVGVEVAVVDIYSVCNTFVRFCRVIGVNND